MKRPTSKQSQQFRKWNRKKKRVRRYINEILDIHSYGQNASMKKFHEWNKQEEQTNLWFYADIILSNAILDACPADTKPLTYCERVFDEPCPFKHEYDKPKQEFRSKLDSSKTKKSKEERLKEMVATMTKEEREQLKEQLK